MLWKRLMSLHERCVLRHSNLSGIKAADVCRIGDLRRCLSEHRFLLSSWSIPDTIYAFTIEELYPWGSFACIILQNALLTLLSSMNSPTKFALCVIKDVVNGITFLHTGK